MFTDNFIAENLLAYVDEEENIQLMLGDIIDHFILDHHVPKPEWG